MREYYFYDLETTGIDPKWSRIMQFAGLRTDADFNIIGEPHNLTVKLTPDILPDPEALMVTGITPQQTLQDGYTEAEFLKIIDREVFTPNTTIMGFNTLRFDDEFMRYTLYRNFYDPYEREWADGRNRWDVIDLVRMTRALRPDGIEWPVSDDGKPTNKLELLTKANKIKHEAAHDALSDVYATLNIAKLLKQKQPKLFEHLMSLKDKTTVISFIEKQGSDPFVHTSGMFSADDLATSVVSALVQHPTNKNAVIVYDLRHSPKEFANLSPKQLADRAFTRNDQLEKGQKRLPVKQIHMNKCPAVAPLGVLDEASQKRINLSKKQIQQHHKELLEIGDFTDKVLQVFESREFEDYEDVDAQLYQGGFASSKDKKNIADVRAKSAEQLADFHPNFDDQRYDELLLRYKARNFPNALSADEKQKWEQYRAKRLTTGFGGPLTLSTYMKKLELLAKQHAGDEKIEYLLQEMYLYGESITPYESEKLL